MEDGPSTKNEDTLVIHSDSYSRFRVFVFEWKSGF